MTIKNNKIDNEFPHQLEKFGASSFKNCYQCGSCSVVCPLSPQKETFPRREILFARLGLTDKIIQSTEPWLCFYCGECSSACPRQAEPGETMMALRRYLITKYDWTGISRLIYTSKPAKYALTTSLSLITILLVWFFHGPVVYSRVDLLSFAPLDLVSNAGIIFGAILAVLLLSNLFRMYRFTIGLHKTGKIAKRKYISEFRNVILQFFTQARYSKCLNRKAWANHLVLMWGYTTLFVLYAVLLPISMVNKWAPISDPVRLAGYFGFAALTFTTIYAMTGRLTKKDSFRRFSHSTDWMFLILLLLTSLTGIFLDLFIGLKMPLATYATFTIHLAVVVPLLALEVPFAKWSHLAYRPFGLYFNNLQKDKGEKISAGIQHPGHELEIALEKVARE